MHIGIDGYEANTHKRVGIGQYAYQVIKYLHQLDQKNSYTIFLPSLPLQDLPETKSNWKYTIGNPGSLWTIRQLPGLIQKNPVDLFFSPTHYLPWFTQMPKVLSVMDLSYLHYPGLFKFKDLIQLKYMGLYSIKRAQKIFTISEFTKKEIIEHYHYPKDKIMVTYPGYSKLRIKSSELRTRDIRTKYGIKGRYILFVGTIQPRKNVDRLIEAFEMFNMEADLVLVGKKGWLYESIFRAIEASPKKDAIHYLDFVTEAELVSLYQNAACFVLPSLYEGFGIPVAEAMQNGCPVVVSNTSSLPEVAGEAGIYVNPLAAQDIAEGLHKALQLKPEERSRRVELGRKHIEQFSWEICAKKTLEVLNSFSHPDRSGGI